MSKLRRIKIAFIQLWILCCGRWLDSDEAEKCLEGITMKTEAEVGARVEGETPKICNGCFYLDENNCEVWDAVDKAEKISDEEADKVWQKTNCLGEGEAGVEGIEHEVS